MFRNPRESARGNVKPLPSVGRPPTPEGPNRPPPSPLSSGPSLSDAQTPARAPLARSSTADKASSTSRTLRTMPPARSASSVSSSARGKRSPVVNNSSKAKPKPNQSILSFFKKVDPPPKPQSPKNELAEDDGDGLFVGTSIGTPPGAPSRSKSATPEVKPGNLSGSPLREQSRFFDNGDDVAMEAKHGSFTEETTKSRRGSFTEGQEALDRNDDARYNEVAQPVKRRRLGGKLSLGSQGEHGQMGTGSPRDAANSENEAGLTPQDSPKLEPSTAIADPITKACTPPPPDTEQQSAENLVRSERDDRDGLEAEATGSSSFVALDNDGLDRTREISNDDDKTKEDHQYKEAGEDPDDSGDDKVPAIDNDVYDENNEVENTLLKRIPVLKQEASSHDYQQGFDDIEDYGDGDFGTGEEFEREYLEEQRLLELAEAEFNNEMDAIEGNRDGTIVDDSGPCCPVCSISMTGISDTDASVHVNNCLDGNPTPLPERNPPPPLSSDFSSPKTTVPGHARFQKPARVAKPPQEDPFTLGKSGGNSSAFSKLMSGHAEDMAWATAAATENADRGKPAYQRTCPFYKILPGFFICVDAFRYGAVEGCNAYFLSHFHSDHYIGLTANWQHGPIYCSTVTANLVKQQLRVDPKHVIGINFEEKIEVPGTKGVHVTMIPANHCPGSSLFLFEKAIGKKGKSVKMQRVLHCGDFRACPEHISHPLLRPERLDELTGKPVEQKIDVCYLDTTYLNPKYAFPSQNDVITACADMCVSLSKERIDKSDGWEKMKRERAGSGMVKFVRNVSNLFKQESSSGSDMTTEPGVSDDPDPATRRIKQGPSSSPLPNLDTTTPTSPSRPSSPVPLSKSSLPASKYLSTADPLIKAEDTPETPQKAEQAKPDKPSKLRGRLLVVIGTYSIGKERICVGIARALGSKIYAPTSKLRICACLEDAELSSLLTSDPLAAQVHMTPLFEIRADTLQDYLNTYKPHFTRVVGFRPTGWNYRPPGTRFVESPSIHNVLHSSTWRSAYTMRDLVPQRGSSREAQCFGVPYSEHSSFRELSVFACALHIDRIIPTVNVGSAKSRDKMKVWIERWAAEKKKNGLFRDGSVDADADADADADGNTSDA